LSGQNPAGAFESEEEFRRQIDERVRNRHDRAVANGEKRILARTIEGDLYSYQRDEITLAKQGYSVAVAPTWRMLVFSGVMAAVTLFGLILAVGAAVSDGIWVRLLLPGFIGLFTWLLFHWGMQDVRARNTRRERGIPEPMPNKAPVLINLRGVSQP
jgi:hypothetical protein